MATPTYATSSELDAVNSILMSVGESPVNTLETQSPEVAIAQTTLRQITREIQAEGWSFNSEQAVKFIPDVNDQIELGDNILSVDINRYYHTDTYDVTMKATTSTVNNKLVTTRKLYDRYRANEANADKFPDETAMYLDIIYMYAFEDIPQPFKDYITAKACRIGSTRMVSDLEIAQALQQDEVVARANAIEYDTAQADYNVFNDGRNRQSYTSFRPFNALQR